MNQNRKEKTGSTLIIDIGSGTQDILLYRSEPELENCVKMILPSPTQRKAIEIRKVTCKKAPLFLSGSIMGGGALVSAIKEHLEAGLEAFATESSAKTIKDNLEKVKGIGVKLINNKPDNAITVELKDMDIPYWRTFFEGLSIDFPVRLAIAVQDHGESPDISNRAFRMGQWKVFMDSGGFLNNLIYKNPPEFMTRMRAVKKSVGGNVILMDTGSAAICGALEDPIVAERQNEGLFIVNIGNSHTLIALIQGNRLLGLSEHHTSKINADKLSLLIKKLANGTLTHQEVFDDGGHGTALAKDFTGLAFSPFVAVTGPKRKISIPLNYYHAVPHGDMMLTGCFGLLRMGREIGFIP